MNSKIKFKGLLTAFIMLISLACLGGLFSYFANDFKIDLKSINQGKANVDAYNAPYGPVIIDLEGTQLADEEKILLLHPNVGGVILYSQNCSSKDQLKILVQSIRTIRKNILIIVDQEGGYIQSFKKNGFRVLPAARVYGDTYDIHPETALLLAKHYGAVMAKDLRECDVDISLAPVLDLNNENTIISGMDRAFHSDPEIVFLLANAFIDGVRSMGMSVIGKHFPGHGSCEGDSHKTLPQYHINYSELEKKDLYPFIKLISSKKLDGIMPGHILFPLIDKENPVTFSKFWLQDKLRTEIGFNGVIISDCLSMTGAQLEGGVKNSVKNAFNAVNDWNKEVIHLTNLANR